MTSLLKQAAALSAQAAELEERADNAPDADAADRAAAYAQAKKLHAQADQTYRAAGFPHLASDGH